jgi:hypothetical protein
MADKADCASQAPVRHTILAGRQEERKVGLEAVTVILANFRLVYKCNI